MSMMAQRLFHADQGTARTVDVAPRHDHQTEIDLAALAEEPALGGGVTEIESRPRADEPQLTTAPGSWDTQVRERGVPDSGEIVRGVSDAALLLAKLFAQQTTGRLAFRRGDTEKVVAFDQGRPVFASSNEAGDRMGELLVREGKITASQYERCQSLATTSGRRMGEILVDVGYLKRRELLPAVRRHVEDIVFSMFAWDRGHYRITLDTAPSAERIRLSRHPASLILEGIRRKLDRSALEALIGPPSTVVEVRDRDRLGGIVTVSDLAGEERAALGGLDGQADLASVARAASIDLADLLPLAWGLCVLGLATARRSELESPGENAALVGETDLAIDRERVHARWRLVSDADYFALLGVRRDATAFEIRRAYQAARRDFAADCFPTDLRAARAFTERDLILKFEGGYHGHADSFLVEAGSGLATLGISSSPGVPEALARLTLNAPYNNAAAVDRIFSEHAGKIAAVIVEPVAANMGVVAPQPNFLESLREITQRDGALLIFDEVITGFRVAYGGAQTTFRIQPDITVLGKIIGGGLPVAAYGGRREIMDMIAPVGPVYQAGTLSGNPLAMRAGLATLPKLEAPDFYHSLNRRAERLAAGLRTTLQHAGTPGQVNATGSLLTIFFSADPVCDYAGAKKSDTARFGAFFREMLARGVLLPPSQFEALFVSAAHTDDDIERTLAAAKSSLISLSVSK